VRDQIKVPVRRQAETGGDLTMERARWELAAMAGRLRTMEARLVSEHELGESLRKERDKERRRYERLRASESYRLGSGLVALVKNPFRAVPRIGRAVLRRLRGYRPAPGRPASSPAPPLGTPVHLYVVLGLEAGPVRSFVETLRQRLLVNPDHRPVVITDSPSFALLRDLGVLIEYLPDRATWERHRPDLPWDEVLSQRLSRLYLDHDTVRTVIVDRSQPPTLADLLR
jgi:hypothetical protein